MVEPLIDSGRHVVLKIHDNGRGILMPDGGSPSPGVGILSMRARLRKFGGDLRIVSSQSGTTVAAKLPAGSVTTKTFGPADF